VNGSQNRLFAISGIASFKAPTRFGLTFCIFNGMGQKVFASVKSSRHSDTKLRIPFGNCWGKSKLFYNLYGEPVDISNMYDSVLNNHI
jgi:hypothetical protein